MTATPPRSVRREQPAGTASSRRRFPARHTSAVPASWLVHPLCITSSCPQSRLTSGPGTLGPPRPTLLDQPAAQPTECQFSAPALSCRGTTHARDAELDSSRGVLARGRKLSTGLLGAVDNSGIGARATRSTLRRAARGHAAGSGILEAPVPATSRRRLCSTTATARTTCLGPRHQRAGVDVATRPRRPGTPTCSHSGARRPDAPHPGVGTCRRTPGVHAPAPGAGQSPPRRSQELPGPSSAPPTLASQHPREPRPAPPARDAHHS